MSKLTSAISDAEIRPALRLHLLAQHVREPDTVLIEELGLCRGQVRVDLAVVNGLLCGYEIKSDRDTLRRLVGQADFYGKVLDRASLVVGRRHFAQAMDLVPEWWGVLLVHTTTTGPDFELVREGRKNPERDPRSLVELLWLEDAISLLVQRDAARGVRGKSRRIVWDRVCEHFEIGEIAAAVQARLKSRATTPGSV